MAQSEQSPVVVAVRDADEASAAVRFGVEEALRTSAPLHLVHVVHPYPTTGQELMVGAAFVGPAREMMSTLALEIRSSTGGRLDPTWDVVEGMVVRTLVHHGEHAGLIVLAGEGQSTLSRVMTGSIRTRVAARAHAPVASIPVGWAPAASGPAVVVAGVEDPASPGPAVRAALEIAAARGSRVRLVHALWFIEPLDDVALSPQLVRELSALAEDKMRSSLAEELQRFDDLDITLAVVHRRPADALVEETQRAELLVLGRRDPRPPLGAQLGAVSRSVLRRASGPVMVAPAHAPSRAHPPAVVL